MAEREIAISLPASSPSGLSLRSSPKSRVLRLFVELSTIEFDLADLRKIKKPPLRGSIFIGGEREIRTLVGVLAQTRFPIVRLQPLGHLSGDWEPLDYK